MKLLRCAVYTRKSTEEGLEQEFNTLDAQREACAAYVQSQRHEGWMLVPSRYDDGGFSGGNMERPALQAAAGRRRGGQGRRHRRLQDRPPDPLAWPTSPRSSSVLDEQGVSLRVDHPGVQHHHQHGPADAQHAAVVRPVRARGHRRAHPRQDRRLEAQGHVDGRPGAARLRCRRPQAGRQRDRGQQVRHIMPATWTSARCRRWPKSSTARATVPRSSTRPAVRTRGGCIFRRGTLYHLLSNRIYRGIIVHKGKAYPGEHEPIVDEDAVGRGAGQAQRNATGTSRRTHQQPSLLRGQGVRWRGPGDDPEPCDQARPALPLLCHAAGPARWRTGMAGLGA